MEELESGEMKAICTSEGQEYLYKVSAALEMELTASGVPYMGGRVLRKSIVLLGTVRQQGSSDFNNTAAVLCRETRDKFVRRAYGNIQKPH